MERTPHELRTLLEKSVRRNLNIFEADNQISIVSLGNWADDEKPLSIHNIILADKQVEFFERLSITIRNSLLALTTVVYGDMALEESEAKALAMSLAFASTAANISKDAVEIGKIRTQLAELYMTMPIFSILSILELIWGAEVKNAKSSRK